MATTTTVKAWRIDPAVQPGEVIPLEPLDLSARLQLDLSPPEEIDQVYATAYLMPDFQFVLDDLDISTFSKITVLGEAGGQAQTLRTYAFDVGAVDIMQVRIPEVFSPQPAPDFISGAPVTALDTNNLRTLVQLVVAAPSDVVAAEYRVDLRAVTNLAHEHHVSVFVPVRVPTEA